MKGIEPCSRREYLKIQSLALLGVTPIGALAEPLMKTASSSGSQLNISLFSKYIQFLNYRDMSEAVREMGFDGIDLTVRSKGHVEPERIAEDLPRATEAMEEYGLAPNMITTRVIDPDSVTDRAVLETTSQLGYRYYRMGWYKYGDDQEIKEAVRLYQQRLQALAGLNRELGLTGSYHNHSGHNFGASVWGLDQALDGLPASQMGCQYDIMHAVIEGGKNWEIGLRLIRDHINTLVIQDFRWARVKGKWKPVNVPAGEGVVDFARLFTLMKQYNINVPVSIHCAFDLGGASTGDGSTNDHRKVFRSLQRDLDYIREAWSKAG